MADVVDLTGDDAGRAAGRPRRGGHAVKEVVVIIVDDDDEVVAREVKEKGRKGCEERASKPKRAKTQRAADAAPVWQGLNGARRLMAEFKEMQVRSHPLCLDLGSGREVHAGKRL